MLREQKVPYEKSPPQGSSSLGMWSPDPPTEGQIGRVCSVPGEEKHNGQVLQKSRLQPRPQSIHTGKVLRKMSGLWFPAPLPQNPKTHRERPQKQQTASSDLQRLPTSERPEASAVSMSPLYGEGESWTVGVDRKAVMRMLNVLSGSPPTEVVTVRIESPVVAERGKPFLSAPANN